MSAVGAYNKTDAKLQRISKTVGAIAAIITAIAGVYGWISAQFQSFVAAQMEDLKNEVRQNDSEYELSVTRIELMLLMEYDPQNITAIERLAIHYFQDLNGDLYMTQKYTEWAKSYGGDINITTRR